MDTNLKLHQLFAHRGCGSQSEATELKSSNCMKCGRKCASIHDAVICWRCKAHFCFHCCTNGSLQIRYERASALKWASCFECKADFGALALPPAVRLELTEQLQLAPSEFTLLAHGGRQMSSDALNSTASIWSVALEVDECVRIGNELLKRAKAAAKAAGNTSNAAAAAVTSRDVGDKADEKSTRADSQTADSKAATAETAAPATDCADQLYQQAADWFTRALNCLNFVRSLHPIRVQNGFLDQFYRAHYYRCRAEGKLKLARAIKDTLPRANTTLRTCLSHLDEAKQQAQPALTLSEADLLSLFLSEAELKALLPPKLSPLRVVFDQRGLKRAYLLAQRTERPDSVPTFTVPGFFSCGGQEGGFLLTENVEVSVFDFRWCALR